MKKSTKSTSFTSRFVAAMVMLLMVSLSFAQNPYAIQLQGDAIEIPENISTFQWSDMPDSARLNDGYVGWIQFFQTPTQQIQNDFKARGYQLLNYIPNKAYLFYFPSEVSVSYLQNQGVRSIVPVVSSFKLSTALKNPPYEDYAMDGDNILVTLVHNKNVSTNYVIQDLAQKQIALVARLGNSTNLELSIPNNCLNELSSLPYVEWVELIAPPAVPEDIRGKSLHRSSGLDTQTTAGRNYTGEGIGVMVRDDGRVGPHIDFEGRITNYTNSTAGTHGDGVAGILCGAGNIFPYRRGMAAGADLHVVNYISSFLDPATTNLINDGTVQITNSSYGDGCNDGYTTRARTVDMQMNTEPTLLHVFSAGNSGTSNCGYGAGSGWGNITGGHKQGKNVIATANTDYRGVLENSSSRGPAADGRIKPDLTANGHLQISTAPNNLYQTFSGTSGAAPGVAGVAAQLYQAYADANGGTLPPAALIKSAMMNTAQDKGNAGPDFQFGWGIINGLRAGLLIEDGRFLLDDVTQGNSNSHTIAVPANTKEVRFMVYWNDPAGANGANPALVNDLDMIVTDPGSTDHFPYILDSTPNAAALNQPATNGIDHLNNMEQVVLDNPAAGNYTVEITGFNVPVGPQDYVITYEIITDNLVVTYPNAGEKFPSGVPRTIHWDAVNTTASFVIDYSIDNGGSWTNLGTVPNSQHYFDWTVPAELSGEALVRVTSGAFQDVSDGTFSIAPLVTGLVLTEVCPDNTASFQWNPIAGAEMYDLYILGTKYMEVAGSTSNTEITVPVADFDDTIWYAIAARSTTDGWETERSDADDYAGGVLNCVLSVEEFAADAISMYPNPATNEVFIALKETLSETLSVRIVNSLGQQLQQVERAPNGSNEISLNVSQLQTGLYFVTIESGTQSTTKKLLIE
ncbi:MAG: S8 family serine peptidase [Altibacter sp.]|uniref:S8/S53 family peptidase n=1 Tax=Altibacter lentus TaxID=1223410 RepID=UPI0005520715|nr:S8 family serine peptidase [Altibacter lentus]MCW8980057.1 S8 family serine peptidase [Altibacter sp.]